MPNSEQAAIWASPAGGSLIAAMMGIHEPTAGDRETMARLKAAEKPTDGTDADDSTAA